MKNYKLAVISMLLPLLVACQNTTEDKSQIEAQSGNSEKPIFDSATVVLPTYGSPDIAGSDSVEPLQAATEGKLTIKNGCVTLTYPKEYYPTATSNNDVIPIFPGGSVVIENGEVLKVGKQLFKNGDFVSLSGSPTVRDFWKSWKSEGEGAEYTAVPNNCHAANYWMTGYIKKMDIDRIGK